MGIHVYTQFNVQLKYICLLICGSKAFLVFNVKCQAHFSAKDLGISVLM